MIVFNFSLIWIFLYFIDILNSLLYTICKFGGIYTNGAEITMLSLSIIAIVSSVSAIGSFSRSRIRMLTEKNKYIDENIKPYIDSLDYNELLVVANAMINSLSDDEANVFQNDIENIDLFLCDDENFNEVVCEKLRDLIEEKIFSFSSEELEAFKINYRKLKPKSKIYKK